MLQLLEHTSLRGMYVVALAYLDSMRPAFVDDQTMAMVCMNSGSPQETCFLGIVRMVLMGGLQASTLLFH